MTDSAVPSTTGALFATYRALQLRRAAMLAATLAALVLSFLVDVATGPAMLPLGKVATSVFSLAEDRTVDAIVWNIRLPVAVIAVLVGACLGLSGVIMQTILNNPLASSYTLGVSAGAGFGAGLVILLGSAIPLPEAYAIPLNAFLFAAIACGGVYGIGRARGATPEMLVLAGIAMLFLFQAGLALLQFIASPEALQSIVFWLFGSLQKATWPKTLVIAVVLVAMVPILMADLWRLTALKLGDERATGLGVKVGTLRLRAFVVISVLTGVAVAFVGTIGFIGLVAPHIARIFLGEDQRTLLPGAALFGALTLSLSSVASKMIVPGAIFPIGIVTALIGVPFFIWLIARSKRAYW